MVSKATLKKVQTWDINNFHLLIEFIKQIWTYPAGEDDVEGFHLYMGPGSANMVALEINTFNLPDNLEIISALQKSVFWQRCWTKSEKGGYHYFDIYPDRYDFKLRADFSKETGISKVMVLRKKEKYDWFIVSNYKRFVRFKDKLNQHDTE